MGLALTYDNTKLQDGLGSQLQRIYGVYALATNFGFGYVHSGIEKLTAYDYEKMRFVECASAEVHETNALFKLPAIAPAAYDEIVHVSDITPESLHLLSVTSKTILVRLLLPYGILDRNPSLYGVVKSVSPFDRPSHDHVEVAVHIRRGELPFIAPSRLIPNRYYVQILRRVTYILKALKLKYNISIYTETTRWDADAVTSAMFEGIPVTLYQNSPALVPFRKLAEADIVVLSHSSYSYSAALLNRHGCVIYNPFWHAPLPSWIISTKEGGFDSGALIRAVVGSESA